MKRSGLISIAAIGFFLIGASCPGNDPISPEGDLLAGTWGGENVAVMVEDTTVHVHIGCTNGDFPAPITVDSEGKFSVAGSYILRAYPIQVGPSLPAQIAGTVDGRRLTFTIAVNDTVEKKLVILGPSIATFGRDPKMGPCPICDRRMRGLRLGARGAVTRLESAIARFQKRSTG
jgi:hypothetical protein